MQRLKKENKKTKRNSVKYEKEAKINMKKIS